MAKSKAYMAAYRAAKGGAASATETPADSSSMSAMQRGAMAEIARMEAEIERIETKPGVVEGQGINRFIS